MPTGNGYLPKPNFYWGLQKPVGGKEPFAGHWGAPTPNVGAPSPSGVVAQDFQSLEQQQVAAEQQREVMNLVQALRRKSPWPGA